MVCFGNEQGSFCRFWDCIQVLHFRLFCWPWWLLHFFWRFLPTVVDIMFIWVKFTHSPIQSILVCWFLECLHSPLPSLVWPLPVCLDSWTWHSRFLCNIALYSIRPWFYHQSHPELGVVFLWLHPFILSGVTSPLISSSILGTYWPGEFLFLYPIIFPFILFMGFSRQEYWSGLPFPSPMDHILSDLSTTTRPSWVARRHGLVSLS